MEWVIYIGIFSSVFLVIYYLVVFGRLLLYRVPRGLTSFDKPVTILVCAHNEAENLRKNLPYLLTQYYENDFEVLVINDHSTDGTAEVLNELCLPYKKLRSIDFTEEKKFKGKKEALSFGLSHARYGHILLTDADCQPASKDWLNLMSGSFDTREVVLGYGGYLRESGFTNKLVRWETLQTAIQYMSLALIGRPYMGVGRNLAYSRELFTKSGGFQDHQHIASGDDDLFISNVAVGDNTAIQLDKHAFTWSRGPADISKWWQQKRRHLSTGPYYKAATKWILSLYSLATILFYSAVMVSAVLIIKSPALWAVVAAKLLVQALVFIPLSRRFSCGEVVWLLPFWEILVTLLLTLIHLQNKLFGSPGKWK